MKKYYICILLFVFCFVITFLYNYFLLGINSDEIWNYGFSYNILHGVLPYRDFNVVVTPLFFSIGCLFIMIFGSHILSYDIYISLIISILIVLCYRKINKNCLLLFFICVPIFSPTYNSLCFLLMIILLLLNDSNFKYRSYFVGFVIGLLFLTKQSVGFIIFLVMILSYKDKMKCVIGFLIPNLLFLIYLIYFDCVYDFINYCFLGLFDFGKSNLSISSFFLSIFIIVNGIMFLYALKLKFMDLNLNLILGFQIISYPIFDSFHVILGLLLYLYYFICKYSNFFFCNFKYYFLISLSFFISYCTLTRYNYHFYDNVGSFLNGKGTYGYNTKSITNLYYDEYVKKIEEEIKEYNIFYDNIYVYSRFLSELSYVTKLDLHYEIDKFDLINNGNMGYNGGKKYILELNDMCKEKKCLFFVDNLGNDSFSQMNENIIFYIVDNYKKIDDVKYNFITFSLYSSY